jgi:hypothetical protein
VDFQPQINQSPVFADYFDIIIGNSGKTSGYDSHIDIAVSIGFIRNNGAKNISLTDIDAMRFQ